MTQKNCKTAVEITIGIQLQDGTDVFMSLEAAKELHLELDNLFGGKVATPVPPVYTQSTPGTLFRNGLTTGGCETSPIIT